MTTPERPTFPGLRPMYCPRCRGIVSHAAPDCPPAMLTCIGCGAQLVDSTRHGGTVRETRRAG